MIGLQHVEAESSEPHHNHHVVSSPLQVPFLWIPFLGDFCVHRLRPAFRFVKNDQNQRLLGSGPRMLVIVHDEPQLAARSNDLRTRWHQKKHEASVGGTIEMPAVCLKPGFLTKNLL